ncbi:MAG: ribbon-helix-helix domain-containing protein, partial [Candidatus Xenobia bacterium]
DSERTTVTLDRALARRLTVAARTSGRSVSAVVREALEKYFASQDEPDLPSFTGIGDSGHTDTSERAEEILAHRFRRSRMR